MLYYVNNRYIFSNIIKLSLYVQNSKYQNSIMYKML